MTALSPTLGLTLALLLFAPAGSAEDLSPRDQAEALFEEYQRRVAAFDPKVADLYWNQARIVNVRKYPGDLPDRALNLVGFQYKAKITKLACVNFARRFCQQAGRFLGLWKCDNIANRIDVAHHRHQAVYAKGNTAVGGSTIL